MGGPVLETCVAAVARLTWQWQMMVRGPVLESVVDRERAGSRRTREPPTGHDTLEG